MASQEARSVSYWLFPKIRLILTSAQGTWQFISAVILAFPGRFKYEVWHDLEAFIHVLHWMCFRFHLTNYSYSAVTFAHEVKQLYDHCAFENGESRGGGNKLKFLLAGTVPFDLVEGSSIPQPGKPHGLHQLLTALASLYGEHYQLLKPRLAPQKPRLVSPRAAVPTQVMKNPNNLILENTPVTARAKQLMLALHTPPETATPRDTAMLSASPFTHDEILSLFSIVLGQNSQSWTFDDKQDDQFEKFKNELGKRGNSASGLPRGSKRSSEDSLEGSSAKRTRTSDISVYSTIATGTPQLAAIMENAEEAFEG